MAVRQEVGYLHHSFGARMINTTYTVQEQESKTTRIIEHFTFETSSFNPIVLSSQYGFFQGILVITELDFKQ